MKHKVNRPYGEIEVLNKRDYKKVTVKLIHWSDGHVGDWVYTDDQKLTKIYSIEKYYLNFVKMDLGFIYVVFDPNSYKSQLPRISFNMAKYRKQDDYVMWKRGKGKFALSHDRLADLMAEKYMTGGLTMSSVAMQYKSYFKTPEEKLSTVKNLMLSKRFKHMVEERVVKALENSQVSESAVIEMMKKTFEVATKKEDAKEMRNVSKDFAEMLDMYPKDQPKSKYRELPDANYRDLTEDIEKAKRSLPQNTDDGFED